MKQKIFKSIADLRFAIFILLVIAAFSVIGTVIEQDQSIETYKLNYPLTNRVFGFLSWDIILQFGLDHIYKTWWFISLIFLFGISLLTCTLLQQVPALKIARRCQFFRTTKQFCRLNISTNLKHLISSQLFFKIKEKNYYCKGIPHADDGGQCFTFIDFNHHTPIGVFNVLGSRQDTFPAIIFTAN